MAKKLEIERKFLLRRLPVGLKFHKVLHIFQYYLKDGSRIRETRDASDSNTGMAMLPFPFGSNPKFELTRKNKLKPGVYEEDERQISDKKYVKLRDKAISVIKKTRYIHKMSKKLKWEIDVYQGVNMVTAEIEIPGQYAGFKMPAAIADELIMDVTEFPQFTNRAMSIKIKST